MAHFIPTVKINFRGKEAQEFEHDALVGRYVHGVEIFFLTIALALVVFGILFLNGINPLNASGNGWVPIAMGGVYTGLIIAKIGLRAITRRLVPEDNLYDRLNVDYCTLNRVMQERNVHPRLIVNGTRYFAPTDFRHITTLLRASAAPQAEAEILLRATSDQSQASTEHLLSPVLGTPVPQTSSVSMMVAPVLGTPVPQTSSISMTVTPEQQQTIQINTG